MNQTYVVKRGDTLWGISNQFGVSVTDLARLNNVTADTLQIGQVLIIPGSSGTNPSNMFIYTVEKGDSLYTIAKKYNTTVDKIIDINNLTNTNLSIGQKIRIPENYTEGELTIPNYVNYTVKKGDSLYTIARNFNTTVNEIINDNSLVNNNLTVGQNLKIRVPNNGEEDTTVVEECFGEAYVPTNDNNQSNTTTYIVKRGDSLYSIAKNFNTSVNDIVKLNNLKSNTLNIGQELIIPSNNPSPNQPNNNQSTSNYTVVRGDSLYSIAKKFNTTVSDIVRLNNLKTNNLSIGQVLKIPSSTSNTPTQNTYTVKKGDSLYSIASKFNTTVANIKSKNNLTSNDLSIGQILKI